MTAWSPLLTAGTSGAPKHGHLGTGKMEWEVGQDSAEAEEISEAGG